MHVQYITIVNHFFHLLFIRSIILTVLCSLINVIRNLSAPQCLNWQLLSINPKRLPPPIVDIISRGKFEICLRYCRCNNANVAPNCISYPLPSSTLWKRVGCKNYLKEWTRTICPQFAITITVLQNFTDHRTSKYFFYAYGLHRYISKILWIKLLFIRQHYCLSGVARATHETESKNSRICLEPRIAPCQVEAGLVHLALTADLQLCLPSRMSLWNPRN